MTIPNPSNLPEVEALFAANAAGQALAGASAAGAVFGTSFSATGASSAASLAVGTAGLGIASTGQATVRGLNGFGTAPTLAAGAGAGSGSAISAQKGHDLGGSFICTTAGTPAPGALATVTFATVLAAAPAAVIVTCWDNTGAAAVAVGPTSLATTGFTVSTGDTPTAAHALLITYLIVAS